MKAKIPIILLLLALLAFLIYKMMQYESNIRKTQVITEYVDEDDGPLIEQESREKLQQLSAQADYYFRADGDYFKFLDYGYQESKPHWETFLMKGVNMGVALPGKFPAEFAMSFDQYMQWFQQIGLMNANIIRVYTILPPEFYEAFAQYNLHNQDQPLYLLHGVWATQPTDHDYRNANFTRNFKKEIIDMLNVIHGNALLYPEKGKASGVYSTDISRYVAGLLLGREWEPNGVFITNQKHSIDHYYGHFVSMPNGNAMEVWLAEMLDFAVLYETQTYQMQHPLSFVNWLPLDPMFHNTEIIENDKVREYDNDLESIHFTNFHSSEMFIPGIYASYHAYPYYPDYIYLKSEYEQSVNLSEEKDNYFGYLLDLKSHHKGIPLVIAEYGLPSSRGNSHITPLGFDQGGHSEAEQAQLSMTLTKDIFQSGCAGALYFEWADEWFKHNWLVMDFEKPYENRKLWHNMENPEQNFGILALESRERSIDGNLNDWPNNFKQENQLKYQFHADAAYFYMGAKWSDLDFTKHNLYIAIDTYDEEKGDHRLPFHNKEFDRGFEFLVEFFNHDSANILVDDSYSVFTDIYNDSIPIYGSKPNKNGEFVMQKLLTNRGRVSLTGQTFDSIIVNRSPLSFGKSKQAETSNADWYYQNDEFELRLDWHLLNVSDPSNNYVLDDQKGTDIIEISKTDGFHLICFITDKNNNIIHRYPNNTYFHYQWESWQQPSWNQRLKPLYDSLKYYFRIAEHSLKLESEIETHDNQSFSIAPWYQNKTAAVSFSFQGSDYSQIDYVLAVLDKYNISASFGIVTDVIAQTPGLYQLDKVGRSKRFSFNTLKILKESGHIPSLQLNSKDVDFIEQYTRIKEKTALQLDKFVITNTSEKLSWPNITYSRTSKPGVHKLQNLSFINYNGYEYNTSQMDSILENNKNKWQIFNYLYITEDTLGKKASYLFISNEDFKRQVRLARNKGYWIANEWDVYRYQKEKENSNLKITQHGLMTFLQLETSLNTSVYNHPLTILYKTSAPYIRVIEENGQYTLHNTTGTLLLNIKPGSEITLKQIW
jgi:hypothetical protein